ncbi:efflux RND transporter permease subunit [Alkalimonas amylolytica]|uniref:Heavy metal efflux pump, CzcA family/hydrophobe/amphiphile efflux-1 (HAE1) family protein n=1 Tax=Alkalimonas amylolytica TaxID=152573 RepID=A0A1H4CMW9_ALKAM|nr:efflux RND transporter permease subunit [Alkalimonas amylolytica]SEA61670.1 heavy metal efflux pump, CzcA family/hydrophobe/amphiphile efflux-1 (HAE1) family protein [Alkalimonas amylolytica]
MSKTSTSRTSAITSWAIDRPVGTLALASVILVLGLFFIQRLPVDLLPHIEYPQIRVTVNYSGVAPEVMEEQVTRVLERNLASVENLVHIDSRASEGRTNVNLHFSYGTNLDVALQNASRALELARTQLPRDIEPPRLYKFDPSQAPIWQAGFSSPIRTEVDVRDWIENRLTPHLIAIEGVSSVEAAGGLEREVQVVLDQHRLAAYQLTMQDVIQQLAAENVDIAGGWVTSARFDVMSKTEGRFRSVEDIEQLLLPLPGSDQRIRLREVASVTDSFREQRVFSRLNGVPAVQLSVFKLPEANTVDVVEQVQSVIAQLDRSGFIPADMAVQAINDPAFFIRGAIASVSSAAILGGSLAMLVVWLFLGSVRKSFVIGLSIPIALMATFALMGQGGLTINIISLGGLALGIGLLLDNAIVMLENIFRHNEQLHKAPNQAAKEGSAEVASAVIAGTMTNLAAVVPFLLITGMAALVFREMILTISFAILATLVAALTLVPMLAALLGKVRWQSGLSQSLPVRSFHRLLDKLRQGYGCLLAWVLKARWWVLAATVVAFLGSYQLFQQLGGEFLPPVDDGSVSVRIALPPGTPPQETEAISREVEALLASMPHVETLFALVGGHLSGGIVNERPGVANFRLQLTPASQRPEMTAGQWVSHTQQALQQLSLPGARISVRPPSIRGLRFGRAGADFSVAIVGEDLASLHRVSNQIAVLLQDVPGLQGLETAREEQSPLLQIRVDRERAADFGLGVAEVGQAIRQAVHGAVPSRFVDQTREYDIRVQLPRAQVQDAEQLGNLLLFRQQGQTVFLRDLAQFELTDGPAHIERENQSRLLRMNADINTAESDVASLMAEVERRLVDLELPDQFSLILGGQWETMQETQRELGLVIVLSIFLVFVVLAVQYEKLSNPLVIIAAAPMSLMGVVLALWLTGSLLSAPVLIGVVLLIGIVVNNAILLVEYIELGRAEGKAMEQAIIEAGQVRLRPILMTTLTTVLGMTPLAIGLGEGAEIMQPLAISVIGGLLGAMLLTLLLVPVLYLLIIGASEQLVQALTGKRPVRH